MGQAVWLSDRGIVRVFGADAAALLQGVITNDVEKLSPREARYAALLTPQGKILFDFFVVGIPARAGADFALDCNAGQSAELAKRLNFYKLRAKVEVADESADHGVVAYWGEPPELTPGAVRYADPRAREFGFREILPRARAESVGEGELAAYETLRVSLGAPKGGVDFAYGDAFPHEANFDTLGGIDFHKGCYVGQEVVSRMQHRGGARKRVVRVELEGPVPEPGTQVLDGDLPAGMLGAASGRFALALLRLDRVEEARAAGRSLKAGEAIVSVP